MFEVNTVVSSIVSSYTDFINTMPSWGQTFFTLFLILVVILFYLLFVRGFYRSISKKDLFGLNLNQYNPYEGFPKLALNSLFYFLEYIVIIPFVVFFWFSILALFLLVLTSLPVETILLVAAVVVVASRVTSYFKRSLSENIAKLLPFNLLAIALLTPNFFNFSTILDHFSAIPSLLGQIIIYILFIVAIEIVMRAFDFIISLFDISFEEKAEQTHEEAGEIPNKALVRK